MLFIKKKESDSEYAKVKRQVETDFEILSKEDTNFSYGALRDKWEAEYELAKLAYKLSKKYADTEQDIEPMKQYRDVSQQRYQRFSYLVKLTEYKSDVLHEKFEFEKLEELMREYVTNDDSEKILEMYQIWSKQYEITSSLYSSKTQFLEEDIDVKTINQCYSGAAFYLAYFYMRMRHVQQYNDVKREVFRQEQCLQKCIEICNKFRGDIKFELMCGAVYIQLGDLQYDIYNVGSRDDNERKKAMAKKKQMYKHGCNCLKKLEEITENDYYPTEWQPYEWDVYTWAVLQLIQCYILIDDMPERAYNLITREIEKSEFRIELGMISSNFTDILKEKLSHFQQGTFGGWKYIK